MAMNTYNGTGADAPLPLGYMTHVEYGAPKLLLMAQTLKHSQSNCASLPCPYVHAVLTFKFLDTYKDERAGGSLH